MSNLTTTSAGGIHFREGLRNLSRAVAGTFKTEDEGDAGLFATLQSPERHPVEEAPAGEHKSEMDDDVSVESVGGLATFAPASVKSTPIRVNGRPSTRLAAKLRAHAHGQAQGKLQAGHRSWVYRNQIDTPICAGVVGTRKDMFCIQGVDCGMKAHKVKFALAEDTVVIVKDEKKAFQNPSLQWELASRSYLYLNNANSELPNDTWKGMFDNIRARAQLSEEEQALDPEDQEFEAAGQEALELSLHRANPTPKRVRLLHSDPFVEEDLTPDPAEMAKGALDGLLSAEVELTRIHTTVSVVASLLGRPMGSDNPGSAWAAIESASSRIQDLEVEIQRTAAGLSDQVEAAAEAATGARMTARDAILHATNATTTASRAHSLVSHLEGVGALGRLSQLEARLGALETENGQLKTDQSRLVQGMTAFMQNHLSSGGLPGSGAHSSALIARVEALAQQLTAHQASTTSEFRSVKGCIGGQGIVTFGRWQFDGPESCKALLTRANVNVPVWEFMVDFMHLLAMVKPVTVSRDEVAQDTIITAKTLLTAAKLTCVASLETTIPEVLAGPKSARDSLEHNLGGMKDSLMWDAGDAIHGTMNFIERSIEDISPSFRSQMAAMFEDNHYELFQFLELSFDRAVRAVTEFNAEIGSFDRALLTMSYNAPPYSAREMKAVWPLVLTVPQVYCEEVSKIRTEARGIQNYADPMTANAQMMWAVVCAHAKHEEFKKCRFREHPRINPKVLFHLFQSCANQADLDSLSANHTVLSTSIKNLRSNVETMQRTVDQQSSRIGNMAQGGGGTGGGAAGAGTPGANARRNRNNRNNRADTAGDNAGQD